MRAPLVFRVAAIPKPQGSKRAFITRPKDGSGKTPKAIVVDSDKQPLKAFRESVRADAVAAQPDGFIPFEGPLLVVLAFALPKPKAAERGPRRWPIGKNAGDVDKLARSVLDALTDAAVFLDDGQVVHLTVRKDYPGTIESGQQASPGVRVLIQPSNSAAGLVATENVYEEGTLL